MAIAVDFLFERVQEVFKIIIFHAYFYSYDFILKVLIKVYHYQKSRKMDDLANHIFLGETQFVLSSLMRNKNQSIQQPLLGGRQTYYYFIFFLIV